MSGIGRIPGASLFLKDVKIEPVQQMGAVASADKVLRQVHVGIYESWEAKGLAEVNIVVPIGGNTGDDILFYGDYGLGNEVGFLGRNRGEDISFEA